MPKQTVDNIILVYANWCPHCKPTAVEAVKQMGKEIGAKITFLDIDKRDLEKKADEIVEKYGDWVPDYLIPQIFFESKGKIQHVFTGYSENVEITKMRLRTLLSSEWYKSLLGR